MDGARSSFQTFEAHTALITFHCCWKRKNIPEFEKTLWRKAWLSTWRTLWDRSISFLLYWAILATVVAWFFCSSLMSLEIICKFRRVGINGNVLILLQLGLSKLTRIIPPSWLTWLQILIQLKWNSFLFYWNCWRCYKNMNIYDINMFIHVLDISSHILVF